MPLIKRSLSKFYSQINNCCNAIDGYAPSVLTTIDAPRIAELKKIRDYTKWVLDEKRSIKAYAKAWTTFGNRMLHGKKGSALGTPPILPVIPPPPPAPKAANGAIYFSDFAASCKADAGYNASIGKDLDIVQAGHLFNPNEGKPILKVEMNAGIPILKYVRRQWSGASIYVDLHDGKGFKKIDSTAQSRYSDLLSPKPGSDETVTRSYRIIYLWKGKEVGTISDPVTVSFVGV